MVGVNHDYLIWKLLLSGVNSSRKFYVTEQLRCIFANEYESGWYRVLTFLLGAFFIWKKELRR